MWYLLFEVTIQIVTRNILKFDIFLTFMLLITIVTTLQVTNVTIGR